MRTIIYFGLISIAFAINPQIMNIDAGFYGVMFFVAVFSDLYVTFGSKSKKN